MNFMMQILKFFTPRPYTTKSAYMTRVPYVSKSEKYTDRVFSRIMYINGALHRVYLLST